MNTELLENIGFTKGEAKVYFSLIELGESTIGPISKKSNVTVSKTYPILDKLTRKGLVTSVIKSSTSYFQAYNPGRILNYIRSKKKKLEEDEEKIKNVLPMLIQKQKFEARNSAVVYESYDGLKSLFDEMIEILKKNREDFIAFTLGEEYENPTLSNFLKRYDLIRKHFGIKTKLIGVDWQREYFNHKHMKKIGMEIRYLSYASVPQGIILVGDLVATIVPDEQITAFVLKSKKTATAYKKFFWDLWKIAKK